MVVCPICGTSVKEIDINRHIDSGCKAYRVLTSPPPTQAVAVAAHAPPSSQPAASFFHTPAREHSTSQSTAKRPLAPDDSQPDGHAPKKHKPNVAPLAERMRPQTLDDVHGQDLVGPDGVIRALIENDKVPSMILWGGPGTGKTTIARLIAQTAGTRFVEINSASTGVVEVKKLFADAKNELSLTGRKTIIFCDEIHRFSRSQQDVFLAPVEAGTVTLIGATTENPSFKVISALLSRCRTFTLSKLSDASILSILQRALVLEPPSTPASHDLLTQDSNALLHYLASFSDGDARTALNLLSLALDLSARPSMTLTTLKSSLTKTLVYDRAGDHHHDAISAFHKSIRGSDPHATLYYLARMLASGEDPLFIARRMLVTASEDVGLADNSLLPLAAAALAAAEKIGLPECRINLAHCAVALALARKSTRSYRGLARAARALEEPGVAGLPIPLHLRNAPTGLMREQGYGRGYKYNPDYRDGRVVQDYLPEALRGRTFLDDADLGDGVDADLEGASDDEGSSAHGGAAAASDEGRAVARETRPAAIEDTAAEAERGPSYVADDGAHESSDVELPQATRTGECEDEVLLDPDGA